MAASGPERSPWLAAFESGVGGIAVTAAGGRGIGRVGRMMGHGRIEVVDLEKDRMAIGLKGPEVMLLMRVARRSRARSASWMQWTVEQRRSVWCSSWSWVPRQKKDTDRWTDSFASGLFCNAGQPRTR